MNHLYTRISPPVDFVRYIYEKKTFIIINRMTQVVASAPDSCYFHFKYFFSDLKQVYDSKVIQVMSTV